MNLQAIAERRAAEQIACRGKELPHDPSWRAYPKHDKALPNRKGGRPRTCSCNDCPKCRNRKYMAEYRANGNKPLTTLRRANHGLREKLRAKLAAKGIYVEAA